MTRFLSHLTGVSLVILLTAFSLNAQRTIRGTITEAGTGELLIGANILVTGTTVGTITNIDGEFTLQIPAGATSITISYTGYQTQVLEITDETVYNIELVQGTYLQEVIITAYGTVRREDLTGAIQSVSTKDFNRGLITGPQDLLAGKVAGVTISSGGAPGDGAAIRVRGESSLSASNNPLIVVDGVPLDNSGVAGSRNPLDIINPNDIESFTVLKDASATGIYGNRASGGVIIITTKKGAAGAPTRVSYTTQVSVGTKTRTVPIFSADEFRQLIQERQPASVGLLGNENTNWQDQIFQSAFGQDHNLNVSGAMGELPYRISIGYTDKDGLLKTDNFKRYSGSLNLSPKLLDNRLQLNLGLKGMLSNNTFANQGAIGAANNFDPTQPVFENNQFGGYFTWKQADGAPNVLAPANPLALLEQTDNTATVKRVLANFSADYRFAFLPELRANVNLAYDRSSSDGSVVVTPEAAFEFFRRGRLVEYSEDKENQLLEFYLNYKKEVGRSDFDIMAGYSWQKFFFDNFNVATNFDGSEVIDEPNFDPRELYLLSLFGRVNYSYNNRLLATFTLRQDGTSRFSEDNRWGLFPAAALAYKLLDNPNHSGLNNLKVRFGWGITGQQDIGDGVGAYYAYLPQYQLSQINASYRFGNNFIPTLRPNGYDANIRWEETTTYNFGVDFGLFRGKVTGALEIYRRETRDLLNFVPVPAGTNLTNFITTNVGDLVNNGIELSFNTVPLSRKNLLWDFGFNIAYNRNEITRLIATDDPNYQGVLTGGIAGGVGSTIQIHSVGFPTSSFYVFQQVYDENGFPVEGLYVDRNGDGVINAEDRYRYQQPAPLFSSGFTSRIQYKNFDFAFAGRALFGNYVYNNVWSDAAFYNRLTNVGILWNLNSAVENLGFNGPQYFSDHFVSNASFLRMDHMTVGYNFNNVVGDMMRLTFVVQNPFVITKYEGLDPEVFNGIDNNIYPRPRTYVLGISVNF
ncbi:MAG TPA: SusC/RagA family TonB-linked outer membrane protein [Saprospiraceae bacterium]|nr:SusC/RagA family TonB-linked outer membrane protein [Saprospiraceae bacterium]